MLTVDKIRQLIDELNEYRDQYYNHNNSLVSDEYYDELFDQLKKLEDEKNIHFADSPTQSVGYEAKSVLRKVTHSHPMLSLDKTKNLEDIVKFLDGHTGVIMAKMDGLTCSIRYENGNLVSAETRGNGTVGEDVTHNIKFVKDVPLTIPIKDTVVVDGEIIITEEDFETINNSCDNVYANPRNLAAGSIRLLDSKESAKRKLRFVLWKVIEGVTTRSFHESLQYPATWGFNIVPEMLLPDSVNSDELNFYVASIRKLCESNGYPIDGCVFGYNDLEYAESLGMTSHHLRSQMAFKFYDEKYATKFRGVDWTMGKTGALTPTAMFDTVDIDGTAVSRASMHNLTIMKKLHPTIGCTCEVFKANMIIPQIDNCKDDGTAEVVIPDQCPICYGPTEIRKDNESEVLFCVNPECGGKLLGRLCTFVSKQGMDIDGLSEGRLQQLIDLDFVRSFEDIYKLKNYATALSCQEGWSNKSVSKLLESIENSKNTTFEHYLAALSIDGIGLTTAKTIASYFNNEFDKFLTAARNDNYDFTCIPGQGPSINHAIHEFVKYHKFEELEYLTIAAPVRNETTKITRITGKTFCITGTFSVPRSELQKQLEACGGIFTPGVTRKTEVLFVGKFAGSKLDKAISLGISLVREVELEDWIK